MDTTLISMVKWLHLRVDFPTHRMLLFSNIPPHRDSFNVLCQSTYGGSQGKVLWRLDSQKMFRFSPGVKKTHRGYAASILIKTTVICCSDVPFPTSLKCRTNYMNFPRKTMGNAYQEHKSTVSMVLHLALPSFFKVQPSESSWKGKLCNIRCLTWFDFI